MLSMVTIKSLTIKNKRQLGVIINYQQLVNLNKNFHRCSAKNPSIIRQKGKSQNGFYKKTKHAKFSEKRTFFTPLIRTRACAYQGVRNVCFSEHLSCLVFFVTPVLRFAFLLYCWRTALVNSQQSARFARLRVNLEDCKVQLY